MRVGFVEWPEGLRPEGVEWEQIASDVMDAQLDILVTNELPFGDWIAGSAIFDAAVAQQSIDLHEDGLRALSNLPARSIVTSRPVWAGDRLCNEAIAIENGAVKALHRKRYLPAEPGWFETSWYSAGHDDFPVTIVAGLCIGVLLCTEALFNERARRYGRAGATLVAIPRATESAPMWRVAGQMAAIVSGSYVVSSNRVSVVSNTPAFGGDGFAFGPDGVLLATTSRANSLAVIEVDESFAALQQRSYPCYVIEPEDR